MNFHRFGLGTIFDVAQSTRTFQGLHAMLIPCLGCFFMCLVYVLILQVPCILSDYTYGPNIDSLLPTHREIKAKMRNL